MAKCKNCVNLLDAVNISSDGEHEFKWCQEKDDCPDIEMERKCGYYKPITNADRIRSMTDEELAEFLCVYDACTMCEHKHDAFCSTKNCNEIGITEKWLQSPVEEGDEKYVCCNNAK